MWTQDSEGETRKGLFEKALKICGHSLQPYRCRRPCELRATRPFWVMGQSEDSYSGKPVSVVNISQSFVVPTGDRPVLIVCTE